jgi:hypothetical protein
MKNIIEWVKEISIQLAWLAAIFGVVAIPTWLGSLIHSQLALGGAFLGGFLMLVVVVAKLMHEDNRP